MPRGWFSGPGVGVLDARYLMLDCTNDPLTAGLEINAATAGEPVLTLQSTDDDITNPHLELQNAAGAKLFGITLGGGADNIIMGGEAAYAILAGATRNLIIGNEAGDNLTTADDCVLLGHQAGESVTTGNNNVLIGYRAGRGVTTQASNIYMGWFAGNQGSLNVAIGTSALQSITTGTSNVGLGPFAGFSLTTGLANFALGNFCLAFNTVGNYNVAIGSNCLRNTTGAENIGIAQDSGYFNQAGSSNVLIGRGAGMGTVLHNKYRNVMVGYEAGELGHGSDNVYIGYQAAQNELGSDLLYISNTNTVTPLIAGDFAGAKAGVNMAPASLAAAWHVDQLTDDAAIPVLLLDQADVDQDMIEFVCTIGVGNAIEAVGAKTLTTTHFIKVTLPGGLTRYIPVGTIA